MPDDTPPRPDPWATTAPREALRDNNAARIMSLSPGATTVMIGNKAVTCFANIVDFCGHDEGYSPDVRFTGQRAMTLRSKTQHVHGGGHGGKCEPIGHARQVRVNGAPVIRHGDQFWMDDRCTAGEAQFVRDTALYPAPRDTDPIPGSVATTAATPAATTTPTTAAPAPDAPAPAVAAAQVTRTTAYGPFASYIQPDGSKVVSDAPPDPVQAGRYAQLVEPMEPMVEPAPPPLPPSLRPPPPTPPVPQGPQIGPSVDAQPSAPPTGGQTSFFRDYRPLNNPAYGPAYYTDLPFPLNYVEPRVGGWYELRDGRLMKQDELERMYAEALQKRRQAQAARQNTLLGYGYALQEQGLQPSGNVRVSGTRGPDPNNPCLLIPYGLLECPIDPVTKRRLQAHHVVADRAFRSDEREHKPLWDQTGYIPGMSEGGGLAICLAGYADDRLSDHGIATATYERNTTRSNTNGMVELGTAEAAGAQGVQDATRGRCQASDIESQLRTYHQAKGMGPDMMVRQQKLPLEAGHSPALGSVMPRTPPR